MCASSAARDDDAHAIADADASAHGVPPDDSTDPLVLLVLLLIAVNWICRSCHVAVHHVLRVGTRQSYARCDTVEKKQPGAKPTMARQGHTLWAQKKTSET